MHDRLYAALRSHALAKLVTQLVSWSGTIYVVRVLDPAAFGLYGIASVVLSYAALIYDGSVTEALVRRPPDGRAERRAAFTLTVLIGLAAAAVLVGLAQPLGALLTEPGIAPLIAAMSLGLVATALGTPSQARLMRDLRFGRLAVVSSLQALVTTGVTVWLAWRGEGAWSLVAGFVAGAVLRAVLLLQAVPQPWLPTTHLAPAFGYLRFGGVLFADNLLWRWYTSVDTFFLARWAGAEAVGQYTLARELANMPVEKVSVVVNDVSLPAFADLTGDRRAAARLLLETIRTHATLGFPLFWGLAAVTPLAVPLVFGEKWTPAVLPMVALCLVAPLRLVGSIETPAITGLGNPGVLVRSKLVIAPIMTVALGLGAWAGGIDGAALAWLLAFPVAFALGFRLILDALDLPVADVVRVMRGPALAAAAMGAAVVGAEAALATLSLPRVLDLVALVALGAGAYALALRAFDGEAWALALARFGRVVGLRRAA